jgi:serine/threonine protein phosphatase PrpC
MYRPFRLYLRDDYMQIHTTLQKGSYHPQHNEDFLVTADIGHGRLLCAVMDGCTMGTESHFASTLTGKVLRKIAVEHDYRAFRERCQPPAIADQLKTILKELITTLKTVKQQLMLDPKELLTTSCCSSPTATTDNCWPSAMAWRTSMVT